ncbi:hypothetical protein [Candidatus Deferrimicrobium sp.]|uniref:hypothetical protein n=1 Tax=Candidatus Deferrimicrobium sp. TaxID=3060586 RepID=UPI0027201A8D|nr:hypothetical protein [Candidatus Deferrimicrobium sp.]MDO8737706.1 hypothetical protein [Candidatus Deferrimicrobium sp.]
MNRLQRKFLILLLAAGIAGGMFVAGCSSKDVRQEAVATVNGEAIKGTELREFLGVPAGMFAVVDVPVEKKKEALDQLVEVRLLAQDGRSRGIDNTAQYKEILQRNDQLVRIKALVRKEIESKLKVTDKEIKAEIAKVKEANKGISDADAAARAVKSVSETGIRKIQEDLIAAAKKETAVAVDPKAVARIGKEENVPDNVVLASAGDEKILYGDVKKILLGLSPGGAPHGQPDLSKNPVLVGNILERELTMRALAAYAKKQGVDGSEGYKSMRLEMERFVLRSLVADNVAAKNVEVTDKEIEAAYAEHSATMVRDGKKIPLAMVKEQIRAALRNEKGKKVIDAYIAELKKKAKITVNDAVLPKI